VRERSVSEPRASARATERTPSLLLTEPWHTFAPRTGKQVCPCHPSRVLQAFAALHAPRFGYFTPRDGAWGAARPTYFEQKLLQPDAASKALRSRFEGLLVEQVIDLLS